MTFGFPYSRFRESRTFHVGEQELRVAVGPALESLVGDASLRVNGIAESSSLCRSMQKYRFQPVFPFLMWDGWGN